jgi:hypothetical protein
MANRNERFFTSGRAPMNWTEGKRGPSFKMTTGLH